MNIPKYPNDTHVKDIHFNREYRIKEPINYHSGDFTGAYVLEDERGYILSGVLEIHLIKVSDKSLVKL